MKNEDIIEMPDNKIDLLNKYIQQLREYNPNGFAQYIDEEGDISCPDEIGEIFDNLFQLLIDTVKGYKNLDFLKSVEHKVDEEKFWDFITGYCQDFLTFYKGIYFYIALDEKQFIHCTTTVFQNYILFNNEIEGIESFTKSEIRKVIKMLNTFVEIAIGNRSSKTQFQSIVTSTYALNNSQAEIVWDLINNNRVELQNKLIMRKLNIILKNLMGSKD